MKRKHNTKLRSTLLALSVVTFVCPVGAPALAQTDTTQVEEARSEEARGLHNAGTLAFEDGRFEDALQRWQAAYALVQLPQLLFNIGTAHDRLGQAAEALAQYHYLEALPEARNANYVRRRVAVLEAQAAERTAATEPAATDDTDVVAAASHPDETQTGGANVPAIVLTATGGALLIAGLATGLVANARYSSLEEACPNGHCTPAQQDDIDSLSTFALTTDILLVVGGLATISGLVWWLVGAGSGDEDPEETTVQLHIGPQSVTVIGRF